MASATERALMNKLSGTFPKMTGPALKSSGGIKTQISTAVSQLKSMTFTPKAQLETEINSVLSDIKDQMPNPTKVSEIKGVVSNCDFFGAGEVIEDAIALTQQSIVAITTAAADTLNKVNTIIDEATHIPEVIAAGILSKIEESFSTAAEAASRFIPDFDFDFGLDYDLDFLDGSLDAVNSLVGSVAMGAQRISDIMGQADRLIACLDAIGGPEYAAITSEYTDTTNDLYDKIGMIDDPLDPDYGNINLNKIYSDAGLTTSEINKINNVKYAINKAKDNTGRSIYASVSKLKEGL
jgi:hypothetical protein